MRCVLLRQSVGCSASASTAQAFGQLNALGLSPVRRSLSGSVRNTKHFSNFSRGVRWRHGGRHLVGRRACRRWTPTLPARAVRQEHGGQAARATHGMCVCVGRGGHTSNHCSWCGLFLFMVVGNNGPYCPSRTLSGGSCPSPPQISRPPAASCPAGCPSPHFWCFQHSPPPLHRPLLVTLSIYYVHGYKGLLDHGIAVLG